MSGELHNGGSQPPLPPPQGNPPASTGSSADRPPVPDPASSRRPTLSPSPRLTAVLAAVMLALGVGVGAAIGPAPESSFAGGAQLPLLLHSLLQGASRPAPSASAPGAAAPAAAETEATPRRHRRRRHAKASAAASEPASVAAATESSPSEASTPATKPTGRSSKPAAKPLPSVSKVWLIQLTGATFAEALAAPSSAPYIDSQAVPSGSLLNGWSALQASTFAGEAALLAGSEPQLVENVIQPPCPEGAAVAQCAPGTPGGLSTADAFLKQTIPAITASSTYRTGGLIVVTFATTAAGSASELPSGSTSATLSSLPAAGALLISPLVAAGKRPSTTFNPSAPRQSLEALLHR